MRNHQRLRRRTQQLLIPIIALSMALVVNGAFGFWTVGGSGTASAAASTLGPPTGVTGTVATNVTVAWTAGTKPTGSTLSGYYVIRTTGGVDSAACGSSAASLLPAASVSCTDPLPPAGTYTYQVVAVLNSWSATSTASPPVTIGTAPDVTPPTMTLEATDTTSAWIGLYQGAYKFYYDGGSASSARVAATVTDNESGPASATFPAITTTGWTHLAQTVSAGTGSAPTITYTSSPFLWTGNATNPTAKDFVGRDVAGNTVTESVTFTSDETAPTGGFIVVNGQIGLQVGTTSPSTDGTFTILRVDFTESQSANRSGLRSSTLTLQQASFANGTCGAFGAGTVIVGNPPQGPFPNGCYRYTLTGTDQVGNAATRTTTVQVDTTAPTGGALSANGTSATVAGSTSNNASGSWTLARTDFVDAESGIASSELTRASANVTNGVCGTFGTPTVIVGTPAQPNVGSPQRNCYRYVLTGTNNFGLTSSLTTTVIVGPFVSNLQLLNGGGIAGRATQGDQIAITFSDAMQPSTMCSTWSGTGNQVLNGDNQVTVAIQQAGSGDTVNVTATGCTFRFGALALGSQGYTTSTANFVGAGANRSTITWTAASRTLTITLGATTSSALGTVASSVATYTPSPLVQNTSGIALGGNFATANIQQF